MKEIGRGSASDFVLVLSSLREKACRGCGEKEGERGRENGKLGAFIFGRVWCVCMITYIYSYMFYIG